MIEAGIITFDCYGTLIDWETGISNAFKSEAQRDGLSLDREDIIAAYMVEEPQAEAPPFRRYREVLGDTAQRVAKRLGWIITPRRASFLADSLPGWIPFPDTNPALERLAEKHKLGLLSNTDDDLIAATRRHFTVPFDVVVTAEQIKSYKPGFAHFQEGLRRAGDMKLLHAARSYYHDIVPTAALGIPAVWVNRKNESIGEAGIEPDYMVSDLAGLARLVLE